MTNLLCPRACNPLGNISLSYYFCVVTQNTYCLNLLPPTFTNNQHYSLTHTLTHMQMYTHTLTHTYSVYTHSQLYVIISDPGVIQQGGC